MFGPPAPSPGDVALIWARHRTALADGPPPSSRPVPSPGPIGRPEWFDPTSTGSVVPSLLFTGGVGDFLALDSWMDPAYRSGIRRMYWAAPNAKIIRELIAANPTWPTGIEHRDLWTDFQVRRAWYNFAELEAVVGRDVLVGVDDWCAARIFPEILSGRMTFHGSSFLGNRLADIGQLDLPDHYALICHGTNSTHRLDRFFGESEWRWVLDRLEEDDQVGVVLGTGLQDHVPDHPNLIDLVDRTSIVEGMEIAKGCSAYIGIDACWSVIASQLLAADQLKIRTTIDHVYRYSRVYYSPHQTYPFVVRSFDDRPVEVALPILSRYPTEPIDDRLVICRELGVVLPRHPEPDVPYDAAYWAKYERMAQCGIGPALNAHRVQLVKDFIGCRASVFDVGIGCGTFLDSWQGPGFGYDVNPVAIEWLKRSGRWIDPYYGIPPAVAGIVYWDSLEHIRDPQIILDRLAPGTFAFVSLPIFEDLSAERIRASKHWRPGEHLQYWSSGGLIKYFRLLGWNLLHTNDVETQLGRECIQTFVFRKA